MNFNGAEIQRNAYWNLGLTLLFSCILLSSSSALLADEIEYHFERMVPKLEEQLNLGSLGDLDVAPDGSVWVVGDDGENARIIHLSSNGTLLAKIGKLDSYVNRTSFRYDIAVAVDGSTWVADTYHQRIQHLSSNGSLVAEVSIKDSLSGKNINPDHITIAPDNSVWITSTTSIVDPIV